MKLKHNNELIDLDYSRLEDELKGKINEKELSLSIISNTDNTIQFSYNNQILDAYIAEDKDKYYVQIEGKQYIFSKVEDEDDIIAGEGLSENIENIVPPMPGTIIKVNVSVGDKVKEGDAIVVVEAMKMETNLYTRINGSVTEINISEGDRVDSETVLVTIKKDI